MVLDVLIDWYFAGFDFFLSFLPDMPAIAYAPNTGVINHVLWYADVFFPMRTVVEWVGYLLTSVSASFVVKFIKSRF